MNKSLVYSIIFATITSTTLTTPNAGISCPTLNDVTCGDVAKIAAIGVGAYATYKIALLCYDQFKEYVENKIISEAADNIVLALTTNQTLQQLPAKQRENAFRGKARLIGMRKRIINRINQILADPTSNFSSAHKKSLQDKISAANSLFTIVDFIREQNPYENEYNIPSYMDAFTESKIVESIVLSCKPNEECTQDELAQKEMIEARRAKIIDKAKTKISSIWCKKAMDLGILALIFTQI